MTTKNQTANSELVKADVVSFPVVGIGASAGGLEAFTLLLQHLPPDTGMGFVLVQHLDPVHESARTKLLAKATSMAVHEITNNLPIKANHVYVTSCRCAHFLPCRPASPASRFLNLIIQTPTSPLTTQNCVAESSHDQLRVSLNSPSSKAVNG